MRFASVLLLCACSSPRADFEAFCHAHERAGIVETDAAGDKAVKIARFLGDNLKTPEAKGFLAKLPTLDPKDKAKALTAEAAKYGVSPCPLADATWP